MKNTLLLLLLLSVFFGNAQTPVFEFVKQYGGTALDQSKSVVTDALGNVYTTGIFNQTADLDPSATVLNFTAFGTNNYPDVFITKSDALGNLIWAKRIGGVGVENVFSIALDAVGNVYTTGTSNGTCDFDPSATVSNLNQVGTVDVFVSKLDINGNFVWAKRLGGSSYTSGTDLVVDSNENVYVTGFFGGTTDFNSSAAVNSLSSSGYYDVFVLKLDNLGNYVWANKFGGAEYDYASSINLDSSNNIITTGQFANTIDFDPSATTYNIATTYVPAYMGWATHTFISKLDNAGSFVWAKSFKGTDIRTNLPYSAVLDNLNNIYIACRFEGIVDFDTSATVQNTTAMGIDTGIVKLNDSGNLQWIKQFGGTSQPKAICLDALNNVYTTGKVNLGTTDFDPGVGVSNLTCVNDFDIFISKLDSAGNFVWVKQLAGNASYSEESFDIAVDINNNIYTVGVFTGTLDFDPDSGITTLTNFGNLDGFMQKISQSSPLYIAENELKDNLKIYPNPTSGNFNIEISQELVGAKISVYTILGQKTKDFKLDFVTTIHNLNKGIYFLEIEKDGSKATKKLMVN
jgi:hypothetical protein